MAIACSGDPFSVLVCNLQQMGFFGFLLPWVFMFAVVFGLLLKTKVLGDDKRIAAVVALVVAFFVIGYGGPFLSNMLVNLFGIAAIVLAGILVTVLFVGMAGGDITKIFENKLAVGLVIGIGIVVFAIAAGALGAFSVSSDAIAVIFIIIIMAVVAYMIVRKE
ncbi:MAG: hypothetical protein HZB67_06190 [Candidatus Aenigmarchaeota archaeon]|nr:hypothetical protein [Candidatus Aenigmarchaeota archaeon]